jgi:hypothetical protein
VEGVVPDPGEHDAVGGSTDICGMFEVYRLWDEDRQLHAFLKMAGRLDILIGGGFTEGHCKQKFKKITMAFRVIRQTAIHPFPLRAPGKVSDQPRSARHFETDGKLKAAEREMMGRIHS